MHKVDPSLRPIHVDIYMAIREVWADYGKAPTKNELQLACRCSITTVYNALSALKRGGYITDQKHVVRGIKPTNIDLTLAREEADPWDELVVRKKYWAPVATR